MRKTALFATAAMSLLVGLASPAAADSPSTATTVWGPDEVTDNQIAGTLGTIGITSIGGTAQKTITSVDWSASEATDATAAGGVSSTSAVLVTKPAGIGTFVILNFSTPVIDPVLFIAHGTEGTRVGPPSGTDLLDMNNAVIDNSTILFTDDATGSIDDGVAIRYPGSRTGITFTVTNGAGATLAATVAAASSIAQDIDAQTPADTPVVVSPTVTPAAGRTVDPGTTRLIDDDGDAVETLVNPEGTYTVDTGSGEITFTPFSGFSGLAFPVQYRVTDSAGIYAAAFLGVEVVPVVGVPIADPVLLIGVAAAIVPGALLIRRRRATV